MIRELPDGHRARYVHERARGKNKDGSERVLPTGGRTKAIIFNGENVAIARGEARCRDNENYNRKIGRSIALGRALKSMGGNP